MMTRTLFHFHKLQVQLQLTWTLTLLLANHVEGVVDEKSFSFCEMRWDAVCLLFLLLLGFFQLRLLNVVMWLCGFLCK